MKEYMKIGDYIKGSARVKFIGITSAVEYEAKSGELFMSDIHAALSHAINSHDELVAEVERLRNMVRDLQLESEGLIYQLRKEC